MLWGNLGFRVWGFFVWFRVIFDAVIVLPVAFAVLLGSLSSS